MKRFIIFCFLSLSLFSKETITWYKSPFTPFIISIDEKGSIDLIFDYYISNIPEYNHRIEFTNINRLAENMRRQERVGNFILLKNKERSEFLYFSKPFDFVLANHFIIKERDYNSFRPYIDSEGYIDLEAVLKSNLFRVSIEPGRFYDEEVNRILELNRGSRNIDASYGATIESYIRKLFHDRVEAFIEYPEIVEYNKGLYKIDLNYKAIPIKGAGKYSLLRFSFPRNYWGKTMVERIDKLIVDYIESKEYLELALMWSREKEKYLDEFRELVNRD